MGRGGTDHRETLPTAVPPAPPPADPRLAEALRVCEIWLRRVHVNEFENSEARANALRGLAELQVCLGEDPEAHALVDEARTLLRQGWKAGRITEGGVARERIARLREYLGNP